MKNYKTFWFGYYPSWTYYLCKYLPFIPSVEYSINMAGAFDKQLVIGWCGGMWKWSWMKNGTKRYENLSHE